MIEENYTSMQMNIEKKLVLIATKLVLVLSSKKRGISISRIPLSLLRETQMLELSSKYLKKILKGEGLNEQTGRVMECEYHTHNFYNGVYQVREKVYILLNECLSIGIEQNQWQAKSKLEEALAKNGDYSQIHKKLLDFTNYIDDMIKTRKTIVHKKRASLPLVIDVDNLPSIELGNTGRNVKEVLLKAVEEERAFDVERYCGEQIKKFTEEYLQIRVLLYEILGAIVNYYSNQSKQQEETKKP